MSTWAKLSTSIECNQCLSGLKTDNNRIIDFLIMIICISSFARAIDGNHIIFYSAISFISFVYLFYRPLNANVYVKYTIPDKSHNNDHDASKNT